MESAIAAKSWKRIAEAAARDGLWTAATSVAAFVAGAMDRAANEKRVWQRSIAVPLRHSEEWLWTRERLRRWRGLLPLPQKRQLK